MPCNTFDSSAVQPAVQDLKTPAYEPCAQYSVLPVFELEGCEEEDPDCAVTLARKGEHSQLRRGSCAQHGQVAGGQSVFSSDIRQVSIERH